MQPPVLDHSGLFYSSLFRMPFHFSADEKGMTMVAVHQKVLALHGLKTKRNHQIQHDNMNLAASGPFALAELVLFERILDMGCPGFHCLHVTCAWVAWHTVDVMVLHALACLALEDMALAVVRVNKSLGEG